MISTQRVNPPKYHTDIRSVSTPPFLKGDCIHSERRKSFKRDCSHSERRKSFKGILKTQYLQKVYYLPYNKNLKEFSRRLRNNSTLGEILLWQKLRAGSMMNYTFNRQKPLDRYIVDFYCKPLNLVIEIDGSYHFEEEQKIKDNDRQQLLEKLGVNFLRFSEQEIRKDMDIVLKAIKNYIIDYEEKRPLQKRN